MTVFITKEDLRGKNVYIWADFIWTTKFCFLSSEFSPSCVLFT